MRLGVEVNQFDCHLIKLLIRLVYFDDHIVNLWLGQSRNRRSSDRTILNHVRTHFFLNWQSFNFEAIFFPL